MGRKSRPVRSDQEELEQAELDKEIKLLGVSSALRAVYSYRLGHEISSDTDLD
jgi:hypothetical protein